MKILHVGMDVNPPQGGPPRSITGLCRALGATEHEVTLFVHNRIGSEKWDLGNCRLRAGSGGGRGGHWMRDMACVLDEVRPDIVHQHGLWCLPLHFDDVLFRRRGIPYVIAPRGLLDRWSLEQKPFKKKLALSLYQMRDLHAAAALHVTADMEARHCRAMGYRGSFITSPNGVNFPAALPPRLRPADGSRRLLFLSRIHPKKGLVELVTAWSKVPHEGWVLEIVGNDSEDYWKVVQTEIDRLGVGSSVVRTPFKPDAEKWAVYRSADCFVLPTHTENFGIVIAEAAFAGLPVITTKGAPWSSLAECNGGWWIDIGVEPLVAVLTEMMRLTDGQREEMGRHGHDMVVRDYAWSGIVPRLISDYEAILSKKNSL